MKGKYDSLIAILAVCLFFSYLSFKIYKAFTIGEFTSPFCRGSSCGAVVSLVESPVEYWSILILMICIASIIVIGVVFVGVIFVREKMVEKVRAFGGNYNKNTFKAILRSLWKSH